MRYLLFFGVLCFPFLVFGNNIRVNGEARVVDFVGPGRDTAIVEFGVSWDNSWRDDFNWDAAWVFLKYKKRGLTAPWEHAYLSREGHESVPQSGDTGNYDFMVGEVGEGVSSKVTGLFLMRDGISEGSVNVKLRLKWPLQGNGRLPLQAEDFGVNLDSVFVAAYAIEMVYVPYGGYVLGDEYSGGTLDLNIEKPIPPENDIIDLNSGYKFETNAVATGWAYCSANNLADRINYPQWIVANEGKYTWHNNTTLNSIWFSVDLGEGNEKYIRYFGISGAVGLENQRPLGEWYFQGSNDNVNWKVLWTGKDATDWPCTTISYPVQHAVKVTNPGLYRYYRVFVPRSSYTSGSAYCLSAQNFAMTEKDLEQAVIDSEEPLYLIAADGQTWTHQLPAAYPKGYRGFYAMKYEVSQEQYVEFLNSLTLTQQKNRVMNNDFEHMSKGDYVFGDVKRPNCRNGIAFLMQKGEGAPALFGNNLNADNKFYSEDDGQTLACNYLSPADMLAYCDWSGLRPMSELEYEKSCRRPSPQIPEKGEYAWNSNSGVNRLRTLSDLTGAQTERETPFDYKINVNAGNKINGPVRSGAFATSRTGQLEAGATYWGLMEMSGNLWELCYNATVSGSVFKGDDVSYSHGDGTLNADGLTDIGASYWPSSVAAFGVRGGSFAGTDSLLRTSDRTYAGGTYFSALTQRDSSVGFRGVRSVLNTTGFTASRIYCANGLEQDTLCGGNEYMLSGIPAEKTVGKTVYSWYVSEDDGTSWQLLEGAGGVNLNYEGLFNTTTTIRKFLFKRKVICSIGEAETEAVTLIVPNVALSLSVKEVIVYECGAAETVIASNPMNITSIDWYYKDTKVGSGVEYFPMRKSFDGKADVYPVECRMNYLKCEIKETLKVILSEVPVQTFAQCGDQVIDCQGNLYTTAKIGSLCWMTENMNVGQQVPGSDLNTHTRSGIQKICYGDNQENCKKYGALYRWEEAMYGPLTTVKYTDETKTVVQGICPDGWRLPTTSDWKDMISHWSADWKPQLGGFRYSNKTFYSLNTCGVWYTTQILGAYVGYVSWGGKPGSYSGFDYYPGYVKTSADGLSVRCVQDF